MTRLAILSDLHIESRGTSFCLPRIEADVLVVAGDVLEARVGSPVAWLLEATSSDCPVVFVPGNHDFFGGSIPSLLAQWKKEAQGSHVHVLYNEQAQVGGVRVLGTTLWSGLSLHRSPIHEAALRRSLPHRVGDFRHIRQHNKSLAWSVRAMLEEHQACVQFLTQALAKADPRTVVATHWPAHAKSLDPRFAGDLLDPYFTNHYPHLVGRAGLWIHGHVHYPFDYRTGSDEGLGRVVCNPLALKGEEVGHWEDRLYLEV